VHVDEDLPQAAVLVFAGMKIDLVVAYDRLLDIALAPLGKTLAASRTHDLDDLFHHAIDALHLRLCKERLERIFFLVVLGDELRR
jgi:hypothetical protein